VAVGNLERLSPEGTQNGTFARTGSVGTEFAFPDLSVNENADEVAPVDFDALFRHEYPRLTRAATLIVGSRAIGEEIAQEALLRILISISSFQSTEHARRTAYVAAMNLARSQMRRVRRESKTLADSDVSSQDDPIGTVESRLLIETALKCLSPRERISLVLVDYVGYSSGDAARILRMRASTVRVHVSRARRKLAGVLKESDESSERKRE
jgi:RNA polymerase sigma factor (sigma-70 family)